MDVEFMINDWLRYFEVEAPLICQATMISDDLGIDCREEHTHFFSVHEQAGHYNHDITPETVEYLGYFVLCSKVYRIFDL
jgi:hypothetical protein